MKLLNKLFFDLLGVTQFPTKRTKKFMISEFINDTKPVSTDKDLVRLGSSCDGGYLVPDDLSGITACFSPGVADCVEFEKSCAKLGMKVFLADHSVACLPGKDENFHFSKKFIGSVSQGRFIRLDEWVNSTKVNTLSDLMLQMDIEGYEYETLISASDELMKRFRIMVIEFHGLHNLWSLPFFKLARSAFGRLLKHHECVHIHPNNARGTIKINGLEIPKLMEFTFYRKDALKKTNQNLSFPHPLDRDNTNRNSIVLPKCWWGD